MKIAVLVGSLRRGSLNKMLAQNLEVAAVKLAPETEFEYMDINLPLFNQDLETDFPAAATKLKQQIREADGVLIVTPEYNRSVPGVLKNAIDWSSRPAGDSAWRNKLVGVVGATPGLIGTAFAQGDVRRSLGFLNARVMATPELYLSGADRVFGADGIANDEEQKFLADYAAAYLNFVTENSQEQREVSQ